VFFSSAFVTIAAYVLRRRLRDAPVFEQAKREQKTEESPIKSVFTVGRRPFYRTFALNIGGNTQSYVFQVFMGSYLIQTVGSTRGWCRRRCWSGRCSAACPRTSRACSPTGSAAAR